MSPKFGDWLINTAASDDNPRKIGRFITTIRIKGKLNKGLWYKMTDGHGDFWESNPAVLVPRKEQP